MTRPDARADRHEDAALARLRLRVAAGARPDGLADLPDDVRPAVVVADRVGAALLPALDAATEAHRHRRAVARQVRTATAPARTVAAGLVLLPLLAVPALAGLLDVDLVGFYSTGAGTVVGAIALALWVAGAARHRRPGRPRAAPTPPRPGPPHGWSWPPRSAGCWSGPGSPWRPRWWPGPASAPRHRRRTRGSPTPATWSPPPCPRG